MYRLTTPLYWPINETAWKLNSSKSNFPSNWTINLETETQIETFAKFQKPFKRTPHISKLFTLKYHSNAWFHLVCVVGRLRICTRRFEIRFKILFILVWTTNRSKWFLLKLVFARTSYRVFTHILFFSL